MINDSNFMVRALELARENVEKGGWPFSALIVKDDRIVAEAVNSVQISHDPSDHAEIAAIRKASAELQSADLSGCVMYVVGLPCPMCLTCIILAKIKSVKFAVDVAEKDEALTRLPPTDGLYNLVSNGYGKQAVEYEHLADFSSAGVDVFKKWNKN